MLETFKEEEDAAFRLQKDRIANAQGSAEMKAGEGMSPEEAHRMTLESISNLNSHCM